MESESSLDPRGLPMFVLGQAGHTFQNADHTFATIDSESQVAACDVSLSIAEAGGAIVGTWNYNASIVDDATLQQLEDSLQAILQSAPANPNVTVSQLVAIDDALHIVEVASTERTDDSDAGRRCGSCD